MHCSPDDDHEKWDEIVLIIKDKVDDLILQCLCQTTVRCQNETIDIAKEADVMMVIEGNFSSNTQYLAHNSSKYCPNTYTVELVEDVPLAFIHPNDIIEISCRRFDA